MGHLDTPCTWARATSRGARGFFAVLLVVGLGTLAPTAEAGFEPWGDCHEVLDPWLEPAGRVGLCDQFAFLLERGDGSTGRLHLVRRDAPVVDLGRAGLAAFVDTEGASPRVYVAAHAWLGPQDLAVFSLMGWVVSDRRRLPPIELGRPYARIDAEIIADSGLYVAARRLGLVSVADDGVSIFSSLGVAQIPELGLLLLSADLTEAGRSFFRALAAQERGQPLAGLLAWRITTRFDADVVVTSAGSLPCVRALEVDDLERVRFLLERVGVDPGDVFQLGRCETEN